MVYYCVPLHQSYAKVLVFLVDIKNNAIIYNNKNKQFCLDCEDQKNIRSSLITTIFKIKEKKETNLQVHQL